MPSTVSTDGVVTVGDIIEGIEWLFYVRLNVSITWVRHWSDVVLPAMFVFNWSRHSCQLSLILWSSWGPITTIEDEEVFYFFRVTLGITCRLKWVVAAFRGLWPRGVSRLMELMLSLVGLLGFPLVFSSFGLLTF